MTHTTDGPIVNGIEQFTIHREGWPDETDFQCARCGSSVEWLDCSNCDDGYSHHDCGEDSCCCLYPDNNVRCDWCRGVGGSWHCVSPPEYCQAHPIKGREHIESTALRPEAWNDA